jgi:hypothetical protein
MTVDGTVHGKRAEAGVHLCRVMSEHLGGFWFESMTDVRADPAHGVLDVFFDDDPPYRLAGPEVSALLVEIHVGPTDSGTVRSGKE